VQVHDRYLLCTDGVHGALPARILRSELVRRASPDETARAIVDAAYAARSGDNATALVLDVLKLPPTSQSDLELAIAALPILAPPSLALSSMNLASKPSSQTGVTAACSKLMTRSKGVRSFLSFLSSSKTLIPYSDRHLSGRLGSPRASKALGSGTFSRSRLGDRPAFTRLCLSMMEKPWKPGCCARPALLCLRAYRMRSDWRGVSPLFIVPGSCTATLSQTMSFWSTKPVRSSLA
jgi:hypothetical protein